MAACAADDALLHLAPELVCAVPVVRGLHDAPPLGRDVVEVERGELIVAAVHAPVVLQVVVDQRQVARDRRGQRLHRLAPVRAMTDPAGTLGGPVAVAVRADHVAPGDLGLELRDARPSGDESRNFALLAPDVVELEHDHVGHPAVGTWRGGQHAQQVRACPGDALCLRSSRLRSMDVPRAASTPGSTRGSTTGAHRRGG
jgi:hypothetical protein